MPLPICSNTTCDIYTTGTAPPAAPRVAGVLCQLESDFERRTETGEAKAAGFRYTHVMFVDKATDVRDAFNNGAQGATFDEVYIPDQNGTAFQVRFVERVSRGQAVDVKKVYLDRKLPAWPTNNL